MDAKNERAQKHGGRNTPHNRDIAPNKYRKTTYLPDKLNKAKMFRAYSKHWENHNRVYDHV